MTESEIEQLGERVAKLEEAGEAVGEVLMALAVLVAKAAAVAGVPMDNMSDEAKAMLAEFEAELE